MATLNLVPDPSVLAVQAGVFLVTLQIVKKLYVEPYLVVRERREKLTIGSKDDAGRFLAEAEATAQQINERLAVAMDQSRQEREAIRQTALAKRQVLLTAAEKEANAHVESVEKEIKADLTAEKAKVPQIVAQLTDEVYKAALA